MNPHNQRYDWQSRRGAAGQFILMVPELDPIAAVTAHNKGMGTTLATTPTRILPAFIPH